MIVKVNAYESVCHKGVWYNQGDEILVDAISEDMKGRVTAKEEPKAKAKEKKEEG